MTETRSKPEHSAYYTAPERIMVGDIDVAYRAKGHGPPLLYFHGLGMTRRWLPF
jgi:hypothetical protein